MHKRTVIAVLVMLLSLTAFAQQGLNIEQYFNDEYLSQNGISSVNISGSQLKRLNGDISLYRSITIENDTSEADGMERAVKKDGVQAVSRTVSINDGHVAFGFYALPPIRNVNRFIIFMRARKHDDEAPSNTRADLFYIEGKVSSDELSRIIRSIKSSR